MFNRRQQKGTNQNKELDVVYIQSIKLILWIRLLYLSLQSIISLYSLWSLFQEIYQLYNLHHRFYHNKNDSTIAQQPWHHCHQIYKMIAPTPTLPPPLLQYSFFLSDITTKKHYLQMCRIKVVWSMVSFRKLIRVNKIEICNILVDY